MLALNRFVTVYVCDRPTTTDYALGLIPLLGIGFHSLLDGVVYSISFSVGTFTGVLVALGMVLHEFPEGIVTYALLRRGMTVSLELIASALAGRGHEGRYRSDSGRDGNAAQPRP